MSTPSPPDTNPESLFAAWLERVEAGEQADLEELCREHPRHAAGLRTLHRRWHELQGAWDRVGQEQGDVDPQVTLAPAEPSQADFSSAVLSRLARQGPASTRYQIKGEVARGGMGAVLRVWDESLRRHLAMKVMLGQGVAAEHGDTPAVDPRMLARFLEEAQVTGQLDHPGIVPVHELGLDAEGRVFFSMKLVKGQTLRQVFDEFDRGEGGWTHTRVLGLIQKICEAMSYAHAKGVIHRDLKPANVMVGKFGEVYVMDWGLARILGRDDGKDIRPQSEQAMLTSEVRSARHDRSGSKPDMSLMTMDGDVVGTPAYMPPEQAHGDLPAMGPHSDVYAVGAMLYHLLAGHMPYVPRDARPNNYAVWQRVQEGPPRPLHEVAPQAPPELVALCEKAMSREVSRRYPDMSALSADLRAYVEGRVVLAFETGAWAEARKWVRRNKPLATSLAAAVLAVVAGSVAFAIKADETRRSAQGVLRLSALQDLEDLLAEADELWPAHPEKIDRFRSWLVKAEALLPELPQHRAKREELRALALPRSAEERQEERESHPDLPRLAALQGELAAKRAALEQRRDGVPAELPAVDWSHQPQGARALNHQAWPLVNPVRGSFGREAEGLVLARRALERAGDDPALRAMVGGTLAWALYAVGRDDEALNASFAALDEAPEESRKLSEGDLARLEDAVVAASSEEGVRAAAEEVARLEQELAALDVRLGEGERKTWRFSEEHADTRWWHAQLTKLIEGLEALVDEETGLLSPDGVSPEHGWSIARRLAFARDLEAGFAGGGPYAESWAEALPAIRAAYPGLDLEAQMGMLPIGPDPASGLWEFAHLMTGVPAGRGEDGKLELTEETGLVFVLLPGGTFLMGAQTNDPAGPHYYPEANGWEVPVHEVRLSPFFLSKYEMTRGQWLRLTGTDPSWHPQVAGNSLQLPVLSIRWQQCFDWLPRSGLILPSEARWEYGARAGTDTPWFTGAERRSVWEGRAANLACETAARAGLRHDDVVEDPEPPDGFAACAPVGSFMPNAFGLHDVLGNVSEFCLDGFVMRFYANCPWTDPVGSLGGDPRIFHRGGSWYTNALKARSSYRHDRLRDSPNSGIGVRPARNLER